jgi:hypothetical protein
LRFLRSQPWIDKDLPAAVKDDQPLTRQPAKIEVVKGLVMQIVLVG